MSSRHFFKIAALCLLLSGCQSQQTLPQLEASPISPPAVQQPEAEMKMPPSMATTSDLTEDDYMRSTTIYSYIENYSDTLVMGAVNKAIEKQISDIRTIIYTNLRIKNANDRFAANHSDEANPGDPLTNEERPDNLQTAAEKQTNPVNLSLEGTALYVDTNILSYRIKGVTDDDSLMSQQQFLNFDLPSGQRIHLFDMLTEETIYNAFADAYQLQYQSPMNTRIFDYWQIDNAFHFNDMDEIEIIAPPYYLSYEQTEPFAITIPVPPYGEHTLPHIAAVIDYTVQTDYSDAFNLNYIYPVVLGENNQFMQINNAIKSRVETAMNYNIALAIEDHAAQENDPIDLRPYYYAANYRTYTNTQRYLSIGLNFYQYTGGAHGLSTATYFNYDLTSGAALRLSDLFEADFDYQTYINDIIYTAIDTLETEDNVYAFEGISEDQKFYLDGNWIVIYFEPYEIAPYAAGAPTFKIPLPNSDM
ncbi:MAG: hypothetical protein PWP51_2494 [Clostridiales bacterium]|jgi:hypothetical protein|nr:hypothetical protein [Clostridiales bacterium]MDN5299941.1 hypothetical protein [Clostridiales bacterium]